MKRVVISIGAFGGAYVVVANLVGREFAWELVFGWIGFLQDVVPRMTFDAASVMVGTVALSLFAVVLHAIGIRAMRAFPQTQSVSWKAKWTASLTLLLITVFGAGTAAIGMTHQIAWLWTTNEPSHVAAAYGTPSKYALREKGYSIEFYQDVYRRPADRSRSGVTQSWETYLSIPDSTFDDFDWNQPWNSKHNIRHFHCAPADYINPDLRESAFDENGLGLSHYSANAQLGDHGLQPGSSNLILIGQINSGFEPWGNPGTVAIRRSA